MGEYAQDVLRTSLVDLKANQLFLSKANKDRQGLLSISGVLAWGV